MLYPSHARVRYYFELTGSGFRNENRGILESHLCGEAEKAKASFTPRACPERSRGDGPPSSVVREEKTKVPRLRKAGPPAQFRTPSLILPAGRDKQSLCRIPEISMSGSHPNMLVLV